MIDVQIFFGDGGRFFQWRESITQDSCVCSGPWMEGTSLLLASMACTIILWHFRLEFTWGGRLEQPKVGAVDLACRDTSHPIHLATYDFFHLID